MASAWGGALTGEAVLRTGHTRASRRAVAAPAVCSSVPMRMAGCGSAVPKQVLSNHDLSKLVDTNDEWIASRTGIRRRHILSADESLTELASLAARRALEMAGKTAEDVDMILLCTSTPEDVFGGATMIQANIKAKRAVAFDLTAACSGFVLGVVTATQYIRQGQVKNVLVIGADALSRFVDWRDRGTCILFGDGCGAVLLTAAPPGSPCGLLGYELHSDGEGYKHLNCRLAAAGAAAKPMRDEAGSRAESGYRNVSMSGGDVFKFAVRSVPEVITQALARAGLEASAMDWLLLHQANQRILDAAAERLGVPHDRVISNLAEYGNTSSASIPLALDESVRSGRIQPGHVLGTAGFGAGLTWGAAILRWN